MTKDNKKIKEEIDEIIKKREELEKQGIYDLDDHRFIKWAGLLLIGSALVSTIFGG